jgi:hypothetical protein
MRGSYPMPGQDEHKVADTAAPVARRTRASLADLLAFLGVLVLAGALVLLADRTGQLSARLAFAGAAGLVAACVNAWRRLRRIELRRWRSGRLTYRGSRVTLVSTWGVEGQTVPAIEPPSTAATDTLAATVTDTLAADTLATVISAETGDPTIRGNGPLPLIRPARPRSASLACRRRTLAIRQ